MAQAAEQTALPRFDAYINGQSVTSGNGDYFDTVNPFTSKPWAQVARCGEAEADQEIGRAHV